VLAKLIVNASKSRSHVASIFNILDGVFQVETLLVIGSRREV